MPHPTTFDLEISDFVATITLRRAEKLNTFTRQMCDEFAETWASVREDDAVRCIVLRSTGRAFSVGADVTEEASPAAPWHFNDPGDALGPKRNRVWKPVVCAVNGMCAGGAFYWLNESDIIIGTPDSTYFDPHTTYGRTAAIEPVGLTYRLPLGDVLRMVLLGNDERMSAARAKEVGLLTEIVEHDALWDRADELARMVAAKPPAAVQGSVKAIWESLDLPRSQALTVAAQYPQLSKHYVTPADLSSAPRSTWTVR